MNLIFLANAFVLLSWNANPPNQRVTQYRIYEQTSGKNYVQIGTTGTTSFKVYATTGFHTYAVSAFNLIESPLSKPDKIKVP